jgi:hypothetical protein
MMVALLVDIPGRADGMRARWVRSDGGPGETVATCTTLCGVRLVAMVRTGQRAICFGLFSLGFDEGVSANVKAMREGLNVIYRRHHGWSSRGHHCLLASLHRIGAYTPVGAHKKGLYW